MLILNQILGNEDEKFNNTNNNNNEEPSNLTSVKFSPDKNYVAIGDNIGNVYIYSLKPFELIQEFPSNNEEVNSIDMINEKEKNKSYLAIRGQDCYIGLLDITYGLNSKCDLYNFKVYYFTCNISIISFIYYIFYFFYFINQFFSIIFAFFYFFFFFFIY